MWLPSAWTQSDMTECTEQVSWQHDGEHAAGCSSAMNPHLSDRVPASGYKSPVNSERRASLTSSGRSELSPRPPIRQAPKPQVRVSPALREGKVIVAGETQTNFRLLWGLAEEICYRWVQNTDVTYTPKLQVTHGQWQAAGSHSRPQSCVKLQGCCRWKLTVSGGLWCRPAEVTLKTDCFLADRRFCILVQNCIISGLSQLQFLVITSFLDLSSFYEN